VWGYHFLLRTITCGYHLKRASVIAAFAGDSLAGLHNDGRVDIVPPLFAATGSPNMVEEAAGCVKRFGTAGGPNITDGAENCGKTAGLGAKTVE
jgi:hypothetical protein